LQKFEQTITNGIADLSQIRIKRINGTKERGLFGFFTIKGPVNDSYKFKVTLYKKQGGQYRLMPYNSPLTPWCSAFNSDPYVVPDVVKHSNMTQPIVCPLSNVGRFLNEFEEFNCN
jgi:hypothetical protein